MDPRCAGAKYSKSNWHGVEAKLAPGMTWMAIHLLWILSTGNPTEKKNQTENSSPYFTPFQAKYQTRCQSRRIR